MIRRLNKKGSMTDAIYVPVFIMVIAMTAFIALYVWMSFHSNFSDFLNQQVASGQINATVNATIQNAMTDIRGSLNTIDYMMPMIVIGLMLVSLIFAFKTGSSIIYAIVSLILWGFALLISALLTNTFEIFASYFPDVGAQYTIIVWVMTNMKYIVLAWLFLIGIVMLTRNKQESVLASNQVNWAGA